MNKKILLVTLLWCAAKVVVAQPPMRRVQQQRAKQNNTNTVSLRAQLSFPTSPKMNENVVWRRDIYRTIDLTQDANAGLYYPVEPLSLIHISEPTRLL